MIWAKSPAWSVRQHGQLQTPNPEQPLLIPNIVLHFCGTKRASYTLRVDNQRYGRTDNSRRRHHSSIRYDDTKLVRHAEDRSSAHPQRHCCTQIYRRGHSKHIHRPAASREWSEWLGEIMGDIRVHAQCSAIAILGCGATRDHQREAQAHQG